MSDWIAVIFDDALSIAEIPMTLLLGTPLTVSMTPWIAVLVVDVPFSETVVVIWSGIRPYWSASASACS